MTKTACLSLENISFFSTVNLYLWISPSLRHDSLFVTLTQNKNIEDQQQQDQQQTIKKLEKKAATLKGKIWVLDSEVQICGNVDENLCVMINNQEQYSQWPHMLVDTLIRNCRINKDLVLKNVDKKVIMNLDSSKVSIPVVVLKNC